MKSQAIQYSVSSLHKCASEINRLHGELQELADTSLERAVKIGEILIGVKETAGHGRWLSWIDENVSFCERTARRYLAVYEKFKSDTLSDFECLTDVYKSLQAPKPEPKPETSNILAPQSPPDAATQLAGCRPQGTGKHTPEIPNTGGTCYSGSTAGETALESTPHTEAAVAQFLAGQQATIPMDKSFEKHFIHFFDWVLEDVTCHPEHEAEVFKRLAKGTAQLRDILANRRR